MTYEPVPCWDCIKGRHLICTPVDPDDDMPCGCPIPHDGTSKRRPVMDPATHDYVDPGVEAEPEEWGE